MMEYNLKELYKSGINKTIDLNQRFTIVLDEEDEEENDTIVTDKIALLRSEYNRNNNKNT